jgi:hypothetical protein
MITLHQTSISKRDAMYSVAAVCLWTRKVILGST